MEQIEHGKITALWLDSGKKIEVTRGVAEVKGSLFVRVSDTSVLVVPGGKVQSIEVKYASKEELDEVFK